MDEEVWADIPGYIGFYQASTWGNVRSLVRLLPSAVEAGVRKHKQVLRPGADGNGRLHVALSVNGRVKHHQVHRLVLYAFVGPCPEGMETLHGDGDHTNNRLDNLRWGTPTENADDQRRHGRPFGAPKKLTTEIVAKIRADTGTQREIALKYGVSQVMIHNIRTGKAWAI